MKTAAQSHRIENQAAHQPIKSFARSAFHDRANHAPGKVGVLKVSTRLGMTRPGLALIEQSTSGQQDFLQIDIELGFPVVTAIITQR